MSNPESLDDLKRLYGAAPADEPPAALDAAILARARGELGSSMPAAGSGLRAWGPQLALAAVLVLTVSLVVVMEREQPGIAGGVAGNVASDDVNVAGIAPPARDLALVPAAKQKADAAAAAVPPRAATRNSTVQDRRPGVERPAPDGAQPSVQALGERAAPAAPERRVDAAASVTSAAPASPAGVAAAQSSERQAAAAAATGALSEAGLGRGLALRASPAAKPALSGGKAVAEESPEAWLRRLAELKQQGRLKEFEEGLAEFRRRHPAYPVPETLVPAK